VFFNGLDIFSEDSESVLFLFRSNPAYGSEFRFPSLILSSDSDGLLTLGEVNYCCECNNREKKGKCLLIHNERYIDYENILVTTYKY
jgi:hypothetical protein